ncbi:PREDICTED: polyamine-modulated factor 1 isoform X2 [Propithecus coquereli]|uniref:polyamine-modulated factor 1 isoform X2 n=1 Tax=Propithecus coquereli TaxID=379532 RepID=UPI00063F84B1|nr:PREDICTED: polyamine-modulated factor 1 isoform X2 [Propithecus coquereli]
MAEANNANVDGACEEKGPEGLSSESVPPGTTISRVKLLDTMVDTFLQKLVAAGSYQRFTDCYKRFYQLQPEMTQRIYDKFITQLQASIREEISEIKEEGNLEAVLNALDKIVEEGKARNEPACNGIPYSAVCRSRRPRTGSWQMPSWLGAGRWRSCSYRSRRGSRPGRLYTENRGSWWLC